MKNTHELL